MAPEVARSKHVDNKGTNVKAGGEEVGWNGGLVWFLRLVSVG